MRYYIWSLMVVIASTMGLINHAMAENREADAFMYAMRGITAVPLTDEALEKVEGMAQGTFEVRCSPGPCQLNIGNTVATLPGNASTLVQVHSTDTGTISQVVTVQTQSGSQNVSSRNEITTVGNGSQSVVTQTENASHQIVATQPGITTQSTVVGNGSQSVVTQTENASHQIVATQPGITTQSIVTQAGNGSQVVITQPGNPGQSFTIQASTLVLLSHIF